VRSYPGKQLLGAAAAQDIADRIRELAALQQFVNIIFAAAPSQEAFLKALVTQPGIPWNQLNAFHMDEYIGLDQNASQTFRSFLKEQLFDKVVFGSVNFLNGNTDDLSTECTRYTNLLQQYPVDIVCMGIGENCHIAFNDPHVANFKDPQTVKIIDLDQVCRQQQVNDNCFVSIDEVPTHALTLTIPALFRSRYIYCMVPGRKKAEAVYNTLNQPISELYPSTILRKHSHAVLYIDRDSSDLL